MPTLSAFIGYFVVLLVIGYFALKATHGLADYLLGGRRLAAPVAALSAGASDMSGWLLLGLPGAIFAVGLRESWIAVGLLAGAFCNWVFVAKPLRLYSESVGNALTLPDFLAARHGGGAPLIRLLSASLILLFFTFYAASGLVAGAKLFSTFGFSYTGALLIGAVVIVGYTAVGGFLAVSWTDFMQGLLMLAALVAVPIMVILAIGDLGEGMARVEELRPGYFDPLTGLGPVAIVSLLAWGFGYVGQPHILVRFMAISDPGQVRRATVIGMSWMLVTLLAAIAVGCLGFLYQTTTALEVEESERVFIVLTEALFNPWIAGIVLAGILAAVMSTIDSQLLVSSSALTGDVIKPFFRPDANDRDLLWAGRMTVLIMAAIAIAIAADPDNKVLALVSYAWAGLGASFGPAVLFSLYWRRTTGLGIVVGMIAGAVTVIVWKELQGGIFDLYELFPAFVIGCFGIVGGSLASAPPDDSVTAHFDRIRAGY